VGGKYKEQIELTVPYSSNFSLKVKRKMKLFLVAACHFQPPGIASQVEKL
jgi:hypothetical protein